MATAAAAANGAARVAADPTSNGKAEVNFKWASFDDPVFVNDEFEDLADEEAATTCCCNARAAAAAAAADEDFFAEDFVEPPPPLDVGKDEFAFVLLPFVMTGTVPVAVAVDAEQGIDGGAAKDAGATASFSLGEFGVLAIAAVPVVVVAVADKLVALAGILALTDGVIAVVADFDILFPWAVLAAILLVEQELLELVFDSRV